MKGCGQICAKQRGIPLCANATVTICTSPQRWRRRGTTAVQFPPLTLPLVPLFSCSLILWPQGPHPPRPAKPPLIIDLRKIHIQYAHQHKETQIFRCLHKTFYNFLLRPPSGIFCTHEGHGGILIFTACCLFCLITAYAFFK